MNHYNAVKVKMSFLPQMVSVNQVKLHINVRLPHDNPESIIIWQDGEAEP